MLFFLFFLISEFTTVAELFWLLDVGFSVLEASAITICLNFAWLFRPCYASVSDRHPSESSLVWLSVIGGLCWIGIAFYDDNRAIRVVMMGIAEFPIAIACTMLECGMARRGRRDVKYVLTRAREGVLGKIVAAFAGSAFLNYVGTSTVFGIQAGLFFFAAVLSFFLADDGSRYDKLKTDGDARDPEIFVKSPASWTLTLFACAVACVPEWTVVLNYFYVGPLGMTPHDIGLMNAIGAAGTLFGTFLYTDKRRLACMVLSMGNSVALAIVGTVVGRLSLYYFFDLELICFAFFLVSAATSSYVSCFVVDSVITSEKGAEGMALAGRTNLAKLAMIVGYSLSLFMTNEMHIDHENFSNLLRFVNVCTGMSLITVVFTFLVGT